MHSATIPEWDLHDRLQKALRESGMSVAALAQRLGVHRNTISSSLHGRVAVDRRTILAWALATGVDAQWLETGKAPTRPGPDGGEAPPTGLEPVTLWFPDRISVAA